MRKNENGRSMIEMLGVLAIIGVLSVGGIYGYTVAMRKYKANEIAQTASMLATLAQSANAGIGDCVLLSDSGLNDNPGGVTITGMKAAKPDATNHVSSVTIQITSANGNTASGTGDTKGVLCQAVEAIAPTDATSAAAKRAGYAITGCTMSTAVGNCP